MTDRTVYSDLGFYRFRSREISGQRLKCAKKCGKYEKMKKMVEMEGNGRKCSAPAEGVRALLRVLNYSPLTGSSVCSTSPLGGIKLTILPAPRHRSLLPESRSEIKPMHRRLHPHLCIFCRAFFRNFQFTQQN